MSASRRLGFDPSSGTSPEDGSTSEHLLQNPYFTPCSIDVDHRLLRAHEDFRKLYSANVAPIPPRLAPTRFGMVPAQRVRKYNSVMRGKGQKTSLAVPRQRRCSRCNAKHLKCDRQVQCTKCQEYASAAGLVAGDVCDCGAEGSEGNTAVASSVLADRHESVPETAQSGETKRCVAIFNDFVVRTAPMIAAHSARMAAEELMEQQRNTQWQAWVRGFKERGSKRALHMLANVASTTEEQQPDWSEDLDCIGDWMANNNIEHLQLTPQITLGCYELSFITDAVANSPNLWSQRKNVYALKLVTSCNKRREARNIQMLTSIPHVVQLVHASQWTSMCGVVTARDNREIAVILELGGYVPIVDRMASSEWTHGLGERCVQHLSKAVQGIHSRKMVHGDVNLGALMVHTSKNELLVADVASAVLELEQGDAPGRCGWYAPEQLKDLRERPSPRHRTGDAARQTDIWAVGVSALCIVARRSHLTNSIENQDLTLGRSESVV